MGLSGFFWFGLVIFLIGGEGFGAGLERVVVGKFGVGGFVGDRVGYRLVLRELVELGRSIVPCCAADAGLTGCCFFSNSCSMVLPGLKLSVDPFASGVTG